MRPSWLDSAGAVFDQILTASVAKLRAAGLVTLEPLACQVYAPPTEFKDQDGKVKAPPEGEGPAVRAWRARMQTPEAQTTNRT